MKAALDDWMAVVIARCQSLAGEIAVAEPDELRARVDALASSLAAPPSRTHNLVLAPLLLDTAFRIADHFHRDVPLVPACPCRDVNARTIRAFLNWREHDATQLFARWADDFFRTCDRHHPTTPASRIARLIRRQPDRAWTLESLAKTAAVSSHGLARAFLREYGVSTRIYVHVCRLDAVLERWSPETKIEAIALEVGYRSRKDFYRVFRQILQTTPALVRRLSLAQRVGVQRRLREKLTARSVRL